MRAMKAATLCLGLAACLGVAATAPAFAQTTQERELRRPPRARIQVTPNQRLVRQCADWYEVERRDTVVPAQRCWWATR